MGTIIIEDDGPEAETTEETVAVAELTEAVDELRETIDEAMAEPEGENSGEVITLVEHQREIDMLQIRIAELEQRQTAVEVEQFTEALEEVEIIEDVDTSIVVEPEGEIIEPAREKWHIEMMHRLPRWIW